MGLTKSEINKVAREIIQNEIFTSDYLAENDLHLLPHIFMPILFGALDKEDINNIGMFYAYYTDAFPMGVSGYHIFHKFRIVNKEDTKKIWAKVQKMRNAIKRVMGEK